MINTIYKPKNSRIWRWKYRQQPSDVKIEDVSLRTSDKQVAEKRRAEMLREKQQERDGIILPKSIRDGAQRNLAEHLQNFLGDLRRCGKSEKHLANLEFRINRLITECPWNTAKAVTADSFQTWRRGKSGLSPKTVNDYLDAARCFFNWLIKNNQIQVNPLVSVEKVKTEGRQTRVRRSFTVDEVKRLVAVAGEHKAAYLMAPHTGLRRSELAQLKWADLHLEEEKPFAIVRASTTKNSKVAPMKLHPELVTVLRAIKGESQPEELVFKRFPRIERFKRDLKKAGIPYQDALGRFADFHALRNTLCTNLAKANVPRRTAMSVMRHSDGKLTDKIYTDVNLLGIETVIDVLPTFTETPSQGASQILVAGSQNGSSAVTTASGVKTDKAPVNIGESHVLTPYVTCSRKNENGARGGSRTHNLRLRRPTLYPIELRARDNLKIRARGFFLNWNLSALQRFVSAA
jgi:integrase